MLELTNIPRWNTFVENVWLILEEGDVYKRRKPPDQRRHQMEMEEIKNLIREKEALFVSFS